MLYRVTSLAYDPDAEKIYYTSDNYAYRNLMSVDVKTGKTQILISHGRIGDIVVNPKDKTIWGLRHLNGLVTLVRIDPPYKSWTQIHTFPYGRIPFDLDISPDGTMISMSMGEINGDQSVQVFKIEDLGTDDIAPIAQFKLGSSAPESFVFSPDGRYLYGSAYYTGVSNIYRFELATQKVEAVSNASTGLFRPIPRADGSLIAFEYTGQGFTPVGLDPKPLDDLGAITFMGTKVAQEHPIVKTWTVGSPAKVPLDSMITSQGKYSPFKSMKLAAIYPVMEGYLGEVAGGVHAIIEDPMQFDQITGTISYTPGGIPAEQRLHLDLTAHTIAWNFEYWHNQAGFYDLFGPTDNSRKGDAIIIGYKKSFRYDPPQQLDFTAQVAGYTGLNTLPGNQNISVGNDTNILSMRLALNYENTTKSLGAVDHEKGVLWNVALEPDYSDGGAYTRARLGFSFGFPIGWDHSSVWLYNAAGAAGGDPTNALAAYYLGAFGNNYVDDGVVERYREYDSFPGYEIDGVAARKFVKSVAEWNLPPIRFSDVGRPSLYMSYMRAALFGGIMADQPPTGGEQTLASVGAQVNFNFTVALRLPMTFSLGYAHGFALNNAPDPATGGPLNVGLRSSGEFMASLKIL